MGSTFPASSPTSHRGPTGRRSSAALHVIQQHWSRRGAWSVDAWALELGVFHEQRPVEMVALRGRDFPVLREVKAESWLGLHRHRQGLGTEARAALLHLAVLGLGAVSAVSEVFQDNAGSQGVSATWGTATTASPATPSATAWSSPTAYA